MSVREGSPVGLDISSLWWAEFVEKVGFEPRVKREKCWTVKVVFIEKDELQAQV